MWSFNGFWSIVRPLSTISVSRKVRVLPSIALELYVYSTAKSWFNRSNSPAVRGRLLSSSAFFAIICSIKDSSLLYRPSLGFGAESGINQSFPSRHAPSIFPCKQRTRTRRSLIPHFSEACFVVIAIRNPSLYDTFAYKYNKNSIPPNRHNVNSKE